MLPNESIVALSFLGKMPKDHAQFVDPHGWIAPGESDLRSPCPGLKDITYHTAGGVLLGIGLASARVASMRRKFIVETNLGVQRPKRE